MTRSLGTPSLGTLTLDTITLGVPDPDRARAFYHAAFALPAASGAAGATGGLDLHGTGRLAFRDLAALAADLDPGATGSGFPGWVLGSIVSHPGEVHALVEAATDCGASILKAPKKQLFGEFAASYRAPEGTVWKLAAASKKNRRPVPSPVRPVETAVYLGVARPSASKAFYQSLGMSVDRDYGDRFVDFTLAPGRCRLGVLPRKDLAQDVGADERSAGFTALELTHAAASRAEVEALVAAAQSAGAEAGSITQLDGGGCTGRFTDPDGYHWAVTYSPVSSSLTVPSATAAKNRAASSSVMSTAEPTPPGW